MRKIALAALALVMAMPAAAMAGGHEVGHAGDLHLSGVKLQFRFGESHRGFFGPSTHRFHGKHRGSHFRGHRPHFRAHRPHFRGHNRFVMPHHRSFRHGFVRRPDFRFKHLRRGFVGPKFRHFKRHGDRHFRRRAFRQRGFELRHHGHFKHRGHRRWRR